MQEYALFKDEVVQVKMEELLYVWAKENPGFKYQQGMNEILAVVLMCLVSEYVEQDFLEQQGIDMNSDESDEATLDACKVFLSIHNRDYLWQDAYLLFENIMGLGVKELYYRESST